MNPQSFERIFLHKQALSLACTQTKLNELPLETVYTKIKKDLTHLFVETPELQT